ncbi:MAG: hypothetical protein IJ802_05160 [Kiritimatiellae bacterium]|nr:hypothetical protein [Kiritimatiellia bacterium]
MTSFLTSFAAGEAMNIAVEYLATAWWVRFPGWFVALTLANLVSHPLMVAAFAFCNSESPPLLECEIGVVALEWLMLCFRYGFKMKWRILGVVLAMNAASYMFGILVLDWQ